MDEDSKLRKRERRKEEKKKRRKEPRRGQVRGKGGALWVPRI
jgi:hypothetical protein